MRDFTASSLQIFHKLLAGQGQSPVLQGSFPHFRSAVIVRSGLATRIVKGPLRQVYFGCKLMQHLESGRTEVIAQKVAPPASFGLKEFVDSDLYHRAWT